MRRPASEHPRLIARSRTRPAPSVLSPRTTVPPEGERVDPRRPPRRAACGWSARAKARRHGDVEAAPPAARKRATVPAKSSRGRADRLVGERLRRSGARRRRGSRRLAVGDRVADDGVTVHGQGLSWRAPGRTVGEGPGAGDLDHVVVLADVGREGAVGAAILTMRSAASSSLNGSSCDARPPVPPVPSSGSSPTAGCRYTAAARGQVVQVPMRSTFYRQSSTYCATDRILRAAPMNCLRGRLAFSLRSRGRSRPRCGMTAAALSSRSRPLISRCGSGLGRLDRSSAPPATSTAPCRGRSPASVRAPARRAALGLDQGVAVLAVGLGRQRRACRRTSCSVLPPASMLAWRALGLLRAPARGGH